MKQRNKTSSTSTFPWKEVLAFTGVLLAAYFGYLGIRSQIEIPIQATQTAEARIINTATGATASTPTFTPGPALVTAASSPPVITECKNDNLINCSIPIPVFVPTESISIATLISNSLVIDFSNNSRNTSAVALQFTPPLDVKGFNFLEISGTSTQPFKFLIEYKIREGEKVNVVKISTHQSFSATPTVLTAKIPIAYEGLIDEIGINFFEKGQASNVVIESIRLK